MGGSPYISVPDHGGRRVADTMLQDLHSAAKDFNDNVQQELENLAAQVDSSVAPTEALHVPTGKPMNAFQPGSWACAFTEFFFGDGTPGLLRDTALLFEEWASCLQEREELQYSLPDDIKKYEAESPNRFVKPEILAFMHDGRRRLGMLTGARACLNRTGFKGDVAQIAKASVEDFIGAVSTFDTANEALASSTPSEPARACLKALLFATSNVPGTEGYRIRQRHFGLACNLLFSPCTLFFTLNLSDTRSPIVLMLDEGPEIHQSSRKLNLFTNELPMPSLRSMHEKISQNPRAQGRFFLLKHELFLRHVIGLGIFHFGRKNFEARPYQEDFVAGSLQSCLTPVPAAGFGLGEAQARGFEHTHNKLHATTAAEAEYFKKLLSGSDEVIEAKIAEWRKQCLQAAATIIFESSTEIGCQLNVQLPTEPFTEQQQKRCRFDGQVNADGTRRRFLALSAPLKQAHIECEENLAKIESRPPKPVFEIPLTNSPHSSSPAYRLLQSFGTPNFSSAALREPHDIPFNAVENSIMNSSHKIATHAELQEDARHWAEAFAKDAFELHVLNHDHRCTTTCGRHKRKQQSDPKDPAATKIKLGPCRFGFDHIAELVLSGRKRRVRRQGKDLVPEPFVSIAADAKEHGRIFLKRTHPFRSASNDISQVVARANVDMQYTVRLPAASMEFAPPTAGAENEKGFFWHTGLRVKISSTLQRACLYSVSCAFRAAHCADYYITKYSSKSLQTFAPLMSQLKKSLENLQADEKKEAMEDAKQKELDATTKCASQAELDEDTRSSNRKLSSNRRARRVLFRMCFAANRSVWLSCTELYTIVATSAAGWATHFDKALFLSRSLFMAKSLKRVLENKSLRPNEETFVQLTILETKPDEDSETTFTETTSLIDDVLHRGPQLKDCTLYLYAMHVYRIPRTKAVAQSCEVFFFEPHYALFGRFAQRLNVYACVPRLIGPSIPTIAQDIESNCLVKALLFQPLACKTAKTCASIENFAPLLAQVANKQNAPQPVWSFAHAWKTERAHIECLADAAVMCEDAAHKQHSILDCVEFRTWVPPAPEQNSAVAASLRNILREIVVKYFPMSCLRLLAAFLCVAHENLETCFGRNSSCIILSPGCHPEQPLLAEYAGRLARKVTTNIDLTAESRIKPQTCLENPQDLETESENDLKEGEEEIDPELFVEQHPNDSDEDWDVAFDDSDITDIKPKFPIAAGNDVLRIAKKTDTIKAALAAKRPSNSQKTLKEYYEIFEPAFQESKGVHINEGGSVVPTAAIKKGLQLKSSFASSMECQHAWIQEQKKKGFTERHFIGNL